MVEPPRTSLELKTAIELDAELTALEQLNQQPFADAIEAHAKSSGLAR